MITDNSLSGARWQWLDTKAGPNETDRLAAAIEDAAGLPAALAWFLAARGHRPQTLPAFLEPRLRDSLPDPTVMRDAAQAIEIICDIIKSKQAIGIFGDYDVDGACSAAIMKAVLEQMGVPVWCHIPDRFAEGYGPNLAALKALRKQGAELIITVDCGISAHEPLAAANELGMRVIVVDHHKAGPVLPQAEAVVNPNRLDDDSGLGYLCAAGVCFVLLAGVLRRWRQLGHDRAAGDVPDLLSVLDMVALACVCDIVPLTGLNRTFVKQGLKILARRGNHGLRALMDVARLDRFPNAHTLGFLLGPRINAGGRLGRSDLGLQLLSAGDGDLAGALAAQLDDLNMQRRIIEKQVQDEAEEIARDRLAACSDLPVLLVSAQGWHEGVIGIVAGRLKDKFNRPAIVITFDDKGQGKGSGRSLPGFSLGDAIMAARQHGMLNAGGGHDMAAGLGLNHSRLADFDAFITARAAAAFAGAPPKALWTVTRAVSVASLDADFARALEQLAPFGAGFAEPRFMITHCRLKNPHLMGAESQHYSVQLDDGTAPALRAVCFNMAGSAMGRALIDTADPGYVRVLGRLQFDSWRGGDAVQFMIDDIALQN